jgi:hypothetical protein
MRTKTKVNLGTRSLKMSKNMNERPTKFLTVSAVSSDSIVKGIIDDTAVKTAEVDEQKTKYLQHCINKHDTIVTSTLRIWKVCLHSNMYA